MTITTLEEARALVGRTFERDGRRRTVTAHASWKDAALDATSFAWTFDGDSTQWAGFREFIRWLSKASEVSKNSSRLSQEAVRRLNHVLELDEENPHGLPGSVLGLVKEAKRRLLRDIRRRRDGREREEVRRTKV